MKSKTQEFSFGKTLSKTFYQTIFLFLFKTFEQ